MKLQEILKNVKNVIDEEIKKGENAGYSLGTIERITTRRGINLLLNLLMKNAYELDNIDLIKLLSECIYNTSMNERINYLTSIIDLYYEE